MATIPSTLIVYSNDTVNLPTKLLHVIIRQIFQYGVKSLTIRGDRIMLSLNYTPKSINLLKKFGNLPVTYLRVNGDTTEEFEMLEEAARKFKFNILDNEGIQLIENTKQSGIASVSIGSSISSTDEENTFSQRL